MCVDDDEFSREMWVITKSFHNFVQGVSNKIIQSGLIMDYVLTKHQQISTEINKHFLWVCENSFNDILFSIGVLDNLKNIIFFNHVITLYIIRKTVLNLNNEKIKLFTSILSTKWFFQIT